MDQIVFWQRIISPHMFGLAPALQVRGWRVAYVVEEMMSPERARMGWGTPDTGNVETILIQDNNHIDMLVEKYSSDTVHLVQGVRANGIMEDVRRSLKAHGARWGAMMETIDERSLSWPLKRLAYWSRLSRWASPPDFILAIGAKTPDWIVARGFPSDCTFPSTYFIPVPSGKKPKTINLHRPFRFGFVGQLIARKRVDLLIDALAGLSDHEFELVIVGDGPLNSRIKQDAVEKLGVEKLSMPGRIPMREAASVMESLDCLVLPSDHDGWGVVVTEALMAGVPAICSDACGAATAVDASGVGGVFPNGDTLALRSLLEKRITKGPIDISEREQLSNWAKCFGAEAGAGYIGAVIKSIYSGSTRHLPPWSGQ